MVHSLERQPDRPHHSPRPDQLLRDPDSRYPAFITLGPDGNVWFGEGSTGRIASITPDGVITERQFSSFGVSGGITTGPDGNIWFTDQTDHAIWRYDLSSGIFTEFRLPTPNSFPGDITTGADANLWSTEQAVGKFGRITPSGVITEFTGVDSPGSITPVIARVTPSLDITLFPFPNQPFITRPGTGITSSSLSSAPTGSGRSRPTE